MRVLVRMYHELDPALNSLLLLPLTDLVENGMEYLVDPTLCPDSYNDINHLVLHFLSVQVNIISSIIDGHVSNDSIYNSPNILNIRICFRTTSCSSLPAKLLFSLLEHLSLLGSVSYTHLTLPTTERV